MAHNSRTRWIATLSLAVSATALGVSLTSGCQKDTGHKPVSNQPAAAVGGERPRVPKAVRGNSGKGTVAAQPAPAPPDQATGAGPAQAEAPSPERELSGKVTAAPSVNVKRLVVTRGIKEREPLPTESLTVGSPVFAFVELQNPSDAEKAVVITFEQAKLSVGHVTLSVSAETVRWRTWGKTRNITQPGTWTAVVRAKDGRELARQAFEVQRG
jgi:hypothetical protein